MTSTERPRMKEFPTWGWYILIGYMIVAGFALPPELGAWALAAGWFAIGGSCIWNYRSCGRIHCSITGPGFIVIGSLSVLEALGLIDIPSWLIWSVFGAIMVVGFGLEFRNRKIAGSCYKC